MNMDFNSAEKLLELCEQNQLPISEVMRQRECILGEMPRDAADHRMNKAWEIMRTSATQPLKKPIKSMGGLIGGEAKKLEAHYGRKKSICGDVLGKAMTYAMAVLEVNASMGLIVAAPTAGSAGVVPGMMLALQECYRISDQRIIDALYNAGAVGYLAMRNATVAGAVGGCQAEIGVASAMAASAAVELMGGTPQQCLDAASTVLMNMLGLVCDPVGGLVEYPCQNRNAAGVANALVAAEMALSGIHQLIPFDQMLDTMYTVGRHLPALLPLPPVPLAAAAAKTTPKPCKRDSLLNLEQWILFCVLCHRTMHRGSYVSWAYAWAEVKKLCLTPIPPRNGSTILRPAAVKRSAWKSAP